MDLHLFLISPDPALGTLAATAASGLPIHLQTAQSVSQADSLLPARPSPLPLILLIDLGRGEYLKTRQWAQRRVPSARVFFIAPAIETPAPAGRSALSSPSFESGEWMPRPADSREMTGFLARLLGETMSLAEPGGAGGLETLVGRSIGFRTAVERAMESAAQEGPILLTGESGGGKSFFARAIHLESGRPAERYMEIDCRTLPEGALTGLLGPFCDGAQPAAAPAGADILLERVEGGTLYLEEISALDRRLQAQLVRWIDACKLASARGPADGARRGGADRSWNAANPRRTDASGRSPAWAGIRLIAGSCYDLGLASRTGTFDRELARRFADGEIKLPPLRERPSDVLLLADHFLQRLGASPDQPAPRLTAAAKERLVDYPWPGNVRELIGVLQIALLKSSGARHLDVEHLAHGLRPQQGAARSSQGPAAPDPVPMIGPAPAGGGEEQGAVIRFREGALSIELPEEGVSFDELEKAILQAALMRCRGNVVRAARLLRLGRGSLRYRLEKHSIMQPRRRRISRRKEKPEGSNITGTGGEPLSRAS